MRWPGTAFAAALFALAGCDPQVEGDEEVRLEIYSWWQAEGEKDALVELDRVNHLHHPKVVLDPVAADRAEDAFDELDAHLAYRVPPATFQANSGSSLLSRVILARDNEAPTVEDSRLEPLDELFDERLDDAELELWPEVLESVSAGGHPFGAPLDLHRINNLFYSVEKLGDHPLPTSVEDFIDLVEVLSAEGGGPAFVIGTRDYWTVETLTFENLLPALTADTPDFYQAFWKGELDPTEAETRAVLDRTLETLQDLWLCTDHIGDPDATGEDGKWFRAFDEIMDPDSPAVFASAGDWAIGYLEAEVHHEGVDYGVVPFPGTESTFIYTSDVFPLPEGTSHRPETRDLLRVALTWEAQVAFNRKKGGIPALRCTPEAAAEISPGAVERVRAFIDAPNKVLAMSGLLTPDIPERLLRDALRAMLAESNRRTGRDIVHYALANHYWMFDTWTQARVQAGP